MSATTSQAGEQCDALCDVLRALASGAAEPRRPLGPAVVGPRLDDRSRAVAGLGAVLAIGGPPSAYELLVADALAAGMSAEEIVDILIEIAQTVGLARLVPAAIELALALGYDVDRALEVP